MNITESSVEEKTFNVNRNERNINKSLILEKTKVFIAAFIV
jgi:hypothetical protein